MIRLIFVLALALSFSCCKSQNDTYQTSLKYDKENVTEFSENDIFKGQEIAFVPISNIKFGNIEILLSNCEGWENDPGDFRKIRLGKTEFVNFGGWTKVAEEYSEYSKNNYFLELDLGNGNPVIVLFGYVYASDPGYLSVISLEGSNPGIVFNKEVILRRIVKRGNGHMLVVDYKGNEHNLYIKEGELLFE